MKQLYLTAILAISAVAHNNLSAQEITEFKAFESALVSKPERDYNGDSYAIELSRRNISNVSSEMIPVEQGKFIKFSVYAHYSQSKRSRLLRKMTQVAIGAGIASVPYLVQGSESSEENLTNNSYDKTVFPIAGALIVSDAFRRYSYDTPDVNSFPSYPRYKNGIFAPNASMRYTFYDLNRNVIKTLIIEIDRQAKDRW